MIASTKEFYFAAAMRQKIIDMLAGIENASWGRFNDRSPNWLTRSRIRPLIEEYEKGLVALGAIPTTAHAPCGHPDHENLAVWKLGRSSGYWRYSFSGGQVDSDLVANGELIIDNMVMVSDLDSMLDDQCPSQEACPCNPSKQAKEHSVSHYFVWPQDPESKIRELAELVLRLREALRLSEDRRPRSAIREELLHAVIALERLLVPVSAEEEIAKRSNK